jgi:hypothetical protein
MIENWIDFGISVLGGATAFLCLYEGTRRLATYGVHRKAVLMTVLAVAICALYGTFAYWKHLDLKATLSASQRKPVSAQLPANWGRGFSPERRESLSLARARRVYVESGTLGDYLDHNGETRSFAPAQEDLTRRERLVAYYTQLEYSARGSLAESLLWLIAAAVAVIFGLAVSLEKAPVQADPAPDAELPPGGTRRSP